MQQSCQSVVSGIIVHQCFFFFLTIFHNQLQSKCVFYALTCIYAFTLQLQIT